MNHLSLRPVSLSFAAALILLSAPRAAPQNTWHAVLAADGVTLIDVASGDHTPVPAGPGVGPAVSTDLTYFEENGGGGGPRGLYDFVPTTGVSTLRVPVGGAQRFFSLAVRPGTGVVYAVDPLLRQIFTVDPNTGVATFVVNMVGVATVADITFDPVTGRLFGAERNAPLTLYTIDLTTGSATTIGTLTSVRSGLTFAPDGTLYGFTLSGTLYRINPANAAETLIGGGGGPQLLEDGTARADGLLFVTDFDGDIFRVDPATGANTLVGNSGSGNGLLGIIPSPTRCRLVPGAEAVRLGTPGNPNALRPGATSRPVIGATWDPFIDHTTFLPGALADVLAIGSGPLNVGTPFGTLLCSISLTLSGPASARFPIPVPDNCSLVGATLCAQGASTNGVVIALTNALDITIGSF